MRENMKKYYLVSESIFVGIVYPFGHKNWNKTKRRCKSRIVHVAIENGAVEPCFDSINHLKDETVALAAAVMLAVEHLETHQV